MRDGQHPYDLQFVVSGNLFKYVIDTALIVGTLNYEIVTPTDRDMHIIGHSIFTNSSGCVFELVENGIDVDGSTLSTIPYNVNRVVNTTSQTGFFSNPTTSGSSGVAIYRISLVANSKSNQIAPEMILPKNSKYLFRFVNSVAATTVSNSFVWYEATN
jgi:hypothetical protein